MKRDLLQTPVPIDMTGYVISEIAGQHHRIFVSEEERNSPAYAAFWDKLRRGEAVLVERKSITESAFGKLMNLFRQKLGHA